MREERDGPGEKECEVSDVAALYVDVMRPGCFARLLAC